jgi:RimJ/RimL family protein N-acetyltransferase
VRATERLLLRRWTDADLDPFATMNADPVVMEHFPAPLSRSESDVLARRADAFLAEYGWGLWAVEVAHDGRFAGFTGLTPVRPSLPFAPAIEVGWRLAPWAWRRGYATEAATKALQIAFDELRLDEVVSFTSVTNLRSLAVMRRLGMSHDPADDFDHPDLPVTSPLRRHVLYRVCRTDR